MKKIWLRSARRYCFVSNQDFHLSKTHVFWLHKSSGYAATKIKQRFTVLHHLILKPPYGMEVDHKNQNKLDNTRRNLRLATKAQNRMNRGAQKNSISGFRGVTYNKANSNFRADIGRFPRKIYLGSFKTMEEAAIAYNKAAKKRYGKFACLNKI